MYYTNSRCNEQRYGIKSIRYVSYVLALLLCKNAEIHAIDAMQAYSTSGNSKLYDINECYDSLLYDIEIDNFYKNVQSGLYCPGWRLLYYRAGYAIGCVKKVEVVPPYLEWQIPLKMNWTIYPNPN